MNLRFLLVLWMAIANVNGLSLPTVVPSRLLARQIERCQTVRDCFALLQQSDGKDDGPFLAALSICGKFKNLPAALKVCQRFPSEACRSLTISICGKCGDVEQALHLWRESQSSVACCHAAMAACAQAGAWREALEILDSMSPVKRTSLTCNIALTALANSKRGREAVRLLGRMEDEEQSLPDPNPICYQRVALALAGEGSLDEAAALVPRMRANGLEPMESMVDLIVAAYGKCGEWKKAKSVEEQVNCKSRTNSFQPWPQVGELEKVGRGRTAYWPLGQYTPPLGDLLTIALQPHRNPGKNGIKLVLLEGTNKVGYLLMVNQADDRTSTLLGVFLDRDQRARGLSKAFMAVWMQLCLDSDIKPITGVMNKPLLCLVLQHTFGYIPLENKGTDVEISPGPNGAIVLYSSARRLTGAFCPRDVKRENLILNKFPTNPRGRVTRVKSPFLPPRDVWERVQGVLQERFEYKLSKQGLERMLLGL